MNYRNMQQLGWISKVLSWVKEACVKRLHTLTSIYDILEKKKLDWKRTDESLPGFRGREDYVTKQDIIRTLGDDGIFLYPDCDVVAWIYACVNTNSAVIPKK